MPVEFITSYIVDAFLRHSVRIYWVCLTVCNVYLLSDRAGVWNFEDVVEYISVGNKLEFEFVRNIHTLMF